MQQYLTQATQIKPLTLDILELSVQLVAPSEIFYQAGQFMQWRIGDDHRCYSLITAPIGGNPILTFCIKLEPKGLGSDFVRSLKIGSEVVMDGPNGFFTIKDLHEPAFFVATGVGVAPFAAMVPDVLLRGYKEPLHLLFGVRSENDVFYFDRFSRLARQYPNFKFTPMLSRPQSHWPGETGYVTTYLQINAPQYKDHRFYLCGDNAMVNEARQTLLKAGHDPRQIETEIFM